MTLESLSRSAVPSPLVFSVLMCGHAMNESESRDFGN